MSYKRTVLLFSSNVLLYKDRRGHKRCTFLLSTKMNIEIFYYIITDVIQYIEEESCSEHP